jgi:metal-responsive CopG/Arc/MetJ family transcriptional regulator
METITFDIPNELLEAFDMTFKGQDKDAIIAELMREAVERAQQKQHGQKATYLVRRVKSSLSGPRKEKRHMKNFENGKLG